MSKAAYLELDEAFSPPAMEPTDPRDMIYTSPANEEMLKPILVSLKHDNGSLVTENVVITASSILSVNWNTSFPTADYYTGKFCRIGTYHHSYWPPRHHDNQRVICLTNSTYSLGYVQNTTYDGVARFELLMHTVVTDGNSRRIVFSVEYGGSNLTVATHPFSVHPEGAKLQINYPANFPNISVNTPMTITVQTFYMDPLTSVYMPLSVGRHSVLHVDLSVSWDSKVYSVFLGEGYPYQFNTLRRADVILGGSEVEMNAKDDLWIRKQCVNGTATFNDVRILTVASDVHINITQSQPYFPWMRIPTQYNDTFQFLSPLEKRLVLNESDSPGTAVTNGFDVLCKCMLLPVFLLPVLLLFVLHFLYCCFLLLRVLQLPVLFVLQLPVLLLPVLQLPVLLLPVLLLTVLLLPVLQLPVLLLPVLQLPVLLLPVLQLPVLLSVLVLLFPSVHCFFLCSFIYISSSCVVSFSVMLT